MPWVAQSVFFTLDLVSGYNQVPIAEKTKTALCASFGLFEINRMPFGLCNEPRTFQQVMECIFADQSLQSMPLLSMGGLVPGAHLRKSGRIWAGVPVLEGVISKRPSSWLCQFYFMPNPLFLKLMQAMQVLVQCCHHEGQWRPIAFASRSPRCSEHNMSNHSPRKLEVLVLKWW